MKNKNLLSPLTYQGNKYWMIKIIKQWINHYPRKKGRVLIEPYFGSGNVTLNLVNDKVIDISIGSDFNRDVSAFWKIVFGNQNKEFAEKVRNFKMTNASVKEQLSHNKLKIDKAFNLLIKSKIRRNGVLKATQNKAGYQKRFNRCRNMFADRILKAKELSLGNNIAYMNFNPIGKENEALSWLLAFPDDKDLYWFIDPPYVQAGQSCYENFEVNHSEIFLCVSNLSGKWLMTYDDHPYIRSLCKDFGFKFKEIRNGYSSRRKNKNELLISNDLSWYKKSA